MRPPALLVLCGKPENVAVWQGELRQRYLPSVVTIAPPANSAGLSGPLDRPAAEQTTAWLCRGTLCLPPITRIEELLSALGES